MSSGHGSPSPRPALGNFHGQTDVGQVSQAGSCHYDQAQQAYAIRGSGTNIWGDHDDFHFVWRRISGDFILTARACFVGDGVEPHRKLGWMVRSSLATDSPHAATGIHGDGLLSLQFRRTPGARTEEVRSSLVGADVIQLERRGTTYLMSVAQHGQLFAREHIEGLELGDEVYIGLFVCSHNDAIIEEAIFNNVRIVVPVEDDFVRLRDPLGSRLELIDIEHGYRRIIHESTEIFEAPNWTLDGQALIFNSRGQLFRFDLAKSQPVAIDTGPVTQNNNDHVLSFDGTMLGISSRDETEKASIIYTVPVAGGIPKRVTARGPSYLHGWSPDGRFLVYAALRNGDFDVYRISVDGGEESQLTTAKGLDDGPEYTPDGAFIYFNSVRSGTMQIWRMRPDGSAQEQVTNDTYNNWFPHISPNGRWIVFLTYADQVAPSDHPAAKRVYLRIMPIEGGAPRVLAYLYGGQGTINVPSWSPDSTRLAFVSNSVPFESE